eukprot:12838854-Heterocapsa_arctica.AAC.1
MDRLFISSAPMMPEEPDEPVVSVDVKTQQLEARVLELESQLAASAAAEATYETPVTPYGTPRSVEVPPGLEHIEP